jgi:hypothetical protein
MNDMPDWVQPTREDMNFLNVQSPEPWLHIPTYLARGPYIIVTTTSALPAKQLPAAGLRFEEEQDNERTMLFDGTDGNAHTIALSGRVALDGHVLRLQSPEVGRFTIRPLTLEDKKYFGQRASKVRTVKELADLYFDPQPWSEADLEFGDEEDN